MTVIRLTPKDRDAWLAARGQDVTASQIGALFGVHDYLTAFELWALKTGRLPHAAEESPAMERGRHLEPVAVALLRERFPKWRIEHNAKSFTYYRDPATRLGATPDVMVKAPERGPGVVQIKSVEASVFRKHWHDEAGEIEVPLWIALQATLEAHLTGATWAAVAPLVVSHGLEMPLIDIPLVPGVIEAMQDKVAAFWAMIDAGEEPTPDYARDADAIDAIYRGDEEQEADLSADNRIPELLTLRADAQRRRREADAELSSIDAEIKAKMGDAVVAHIGQGRRITWKLTTKQGFWSPPVTFRQLRTPKERD